MWIAAGVVFIGIGSAGSHLPLWSNSTFNDSGNKPSGIIDERGVYFRDKSLVLAKRATFREPEWPTARTEVPPPRVLPTCGLMGTSGLDFGPYTHLLDECALADPLPHLPGCTTPVPRDLPPARSGRVPGDSRNRREPLSQTLQVYNHLAASSAPIASGRGAAQGNHRAERGKYGRLIDRTFYRYVRSRR